MLHVRLWSAVVVFVLFAGTLFGQGSGSVFGVAKDESGAVIPGVEITLTNVGTGVTRTVITDEGGRYRGENLDLGAYTVRAQLPGFQTVVRAGIQLTLGREAQVDFTLQVGALTETMEVFGDAPMVETSSSSLAELIDNRQIRDLPLNGRDLFQLATLEAGVSAQGQVPGNDRRGFAKQLSFAGARPQSNMYTLDGSDIRTNRNFASPEGVSGLWLGVEAIQEFQVVLNGASAQYSNAAGGVLTAITRSGTNDFHGSVFEFLRNDNLDARNFFDPVSGPPEFKRNQFGFAAGGPIIKNRTFFFGTYEGARQNLGRTTVGSTLSENAKKGILPGLAPISVRPEIRAIAEVFPVGVDRGDGTAEIRTTQVDSLKEDYLSIRVDHHFGPNDSLFGRYNWNAGFRDLVLQLPVFRDSVDDGRNNAVTEYKRIISPTVLNLFRLSYNRWTQKLASKSLVSEATVAPMKLRPNIPGWTIVSIPGILDDLGHDNQTPTREIMNRYELGDDLSWVKGRHSLKAGFLGKWLRLFQDSPNRLGGTWEFRSIRDFLLGNARRLNSGALNFDSQANLRQAIYAWYVQDDFQFRPNLTLNLGLRHEWNSVPTEINGKLKALVSVLDAGFTPGEPVFQNPSKENFAPRIGFAWDPGGNGRSSVRAGFGVFYELIQTHQFSSMATRNPPGARQVILEPAVFPNLLTELARAPFADTTLDTIDFRISQPYVMQWNLTLQREVGPRAALTVGYVGSRGNHLMSSRDANTPLPSAIIDGKKFWAAGLPRRNRNISEIRYRFSAAQSFFHGLSLRFTQQYGDGFQVVAGYKLGKSVDDHSSISTRDYGFRQDSTDPDNQGLNRALSAHDVRHNFTFNVVSMLPFGKNLTGLAGALVLGWQATGILTVSSGPPFPVALAFDNARNLLSRHHRPDLRPGASNNPITGNPDRYIDPSAFLLPRPGFLGNLGRNTVIGPGLANTDVALLKNFSVRAVSEGLKVQFRAEMFNVFNHANFDVPTENHYVFNSDGSVPAIFGQLRRTTTPARQIQFGLKILW